MREEFGDFWAFLGDIHVITTNGTLKNNGTCVMGRGIAREAKIRFPGIDKTLGREIRNHGNKVHKLGCWTRADGAIFNIMSFPVKHQWFEQADIELIKDSAARLAYEVTNEKRIIMVRPGCGNGGLHWDTVKPEIEDYLDNRFVIVERKQA